MARWKNEVETLLVQIEKNTDRMADASERTANAAEDIFNALDDAQRQAIRRGR